MTFYLVLTRSGCRVVKRRPPPTPGEWVVQLTVTYPPPLPVPTLAIDLPAELVLERVEADVSAQVADGEHADVEP